MATTERVALLVLQLFVISSLINGQNTQKNVLVIIGNVIIQYWRYRLGPVYDYFIPYTHPLLVCPVLRMRNCSVGVAQGTRTSRLGL